MLEIVKFLSFQILAPIVAFSVVAFIPYTFGINVESIIRKR